MVKVEIVEEKDQQATNSPYASSASSRTSSSVSLSSVDSDSPVDESILDRLSALKDIVPPTTRHSIASKVSKTASFFKRTTKVAGNVIWVVTTSALLIGLPLALILEDEAKVVAQENEMLAQQQGAQQVRIYTPLFCFHSSPLFRWYLVAPYTRPQPTLRSRVPANRLLYHQASKPILSPAYLCILVSLAIHVVIRIIPIY
jgi:import receptor subunit TOM22